jgi:hypothetical protein
MLPLLTGHVLLIEYNVGTANNLVVGDGGEPVHLHAGANSAEHVKFALGIEFADATGDNLYPGSVAPGADMLVGVGLGATRPQLLASVCTTRVPGEPVEHVY